jgi:NADPH:quinone reductase-like Zn-dependent oxidoreductase
MKTIVYKRYGLPDLFKCVASNKPTAKCNEVCTKIRAATVTSGDCRVRGLNVPSGFGLRARMMFGMNEPRQGVLGTELAGVIDGVGSQVAKFKVGDPVLAFHDCAMGYHAPLACPRAVQSRQSRST